MAKITNASASFVDYDGETGRCSWGMVPVTDAASAELVRVNSEIVANSLATLTRGVRLSHQFTSVVPVAPPQSTAPDPNAQREEKWLMVYYDNTQFSDAPADTIPNPGYLKVFSLEIPVANLEIRENNSDTIYKGGAPTVSANGNDLLVQDVVDLFELHARSPYNGEVVVLEIRDVSRNI